MPNLGQHPMQGVVPLDSQRVRQAALRREVIALAGMPVPLAQLKMALGLGFERPNAQDPAESGPRWTDESNRRSPELERYIREMHVMHERAMGILQTRVQASAAVPPPADWSKGASPRLQKKRQRDSAELTAVEILARMRDSTSPLPA